MKQVKRIIINYSLWLIIIFYLLTRLLFLTRLPIFTDESIYIYWAKLISTTHSQWFVSLTDGKPPLLVWMIAALLTLLPQKAYLIAGRLPSVIAGLASVIALWQLSGLLFKSKKAQVIVTILYIINPFTLLYDKIALFDSLLQATMLWSVYFAVKTAVSLKWKDAVWWGIALGLTFLSKPTALIFVGLTPLVMLLYSQTAHKKFLWKEWVKFSITAVVISEVINNLQRVSHVYYLAGIKNSQFQQPISKLLKNPFALTWGNLHGFFSWIIGYYTVPFFILVLVGFTVLVWKKRNVGISLLLLWFIPIFALATVGLEIFPRYVLFTTPYALLAAGYVFYLVLSTKNKYRILSFIFFCVVCLPMFLLSSVLLIAPEKAAIPPTDYRQYVSEHPSGYGLQKVFSFIDAQSKKQKVTVVTQGTFGLYPYAFTLQYWGDPNVSILPRWPLTSLDQSIYDAEKTSKVFVILKDTPSIPVNMPLDLVLRSTKPGGEYPILVTKLKK